MSLEFKYYKINDIGEVVSGGTPSTSKNEYWYGDIGWITPKDLSSYDDIYISRGERNISSEGLNNSSAKLVPKNTVLMTSRAPIGYIAIANNELSTNQGFKSLICNEKICHYKYFYYWLKLNIKYIINNSNGSTFKEISGGTFKNLELSLPSLNEQKAISSVLWTIDEKISVLKRINKNLEEQIETIYNSFFVYYDDFSKEELEECEIGLIPKDWELMSLGEVTTKIKEKVGSDDYKVFSAVNTGNLILSEEYFDKQVYSKNIEKYIVVKQKEFAYNPARINIGSIGRNDFNYDGCVSPVYVAFKVEEGYENFMNMYIKSNRFNQWVVTLSSGSVRQTLNYADFSIIKIAYPPKDLVNKFNKVYDNYYEVINYNNSVISNLENIRDTLLPKLMSGEIDVSKINCDLELKYNYMKYLFNQIHTPMSKSVV
ncbi:restriction endonuclease subunit S [Methanobrevibacter smithii]|uniref:restriction endonuclease subunit S n=3 Tax=Methanobrevibacter smithii TaxID=2173 RepID=UPI0037DC8324